MAANLLNGVVAYGEVDIQWQDGVPLQARRPNLSPVWTAVPAAFWQAVLANARQDQWAPFAYIAYLESRYVENIDVIDTNGQHSRGALEVNGVWSQYDNDSMLHYGPNIAAGQVIFDAQGYGAWFNSATLLGLPGGANQQPAPTPAPVTPTPPNTPPPAPGTTVVSVAINLFGLRIVDVAHNDNDNTVVVTGVPTANPQP